MKEEPNTKFYFDGKIARVVFEDDEKRKAYWFDAAEFSYLHHLHLHHLHLHYLHHKHFLHLLPREEWLEENNMKCVEDDMMLFELTWV